MNAKLILRAFKVMAASLLAIAVALGVTAQAQAFCSSCNSAAPAYSVGYAAPAMYTAAYAPAYTTAYAPAYTTAYNGGWYPGQFLGRVNRAVWGYPTTTYYAPVAYTAAYAPAYTAAYAAPGCSNCSAGYAAPACSTCSASYAPACSTCTASYAPACSTCGVSYAPGCSTCSACSSGTVSESYAVAAPGCSTCAAGTVEQASYTETVVSPPPAPSTYGTSTTPAPPTNEPQPEIDPSLNLPAERSQLETQKPEVTEPATQPAPQPGPASTTEESATNLQAPQLFDPNDRTAARHAAPVWTAVYHRVGNADRAIQPVSRSTGLPENVSLEQVERDAAGWTSASK
jgi:hypothetical protein